MSAISKAESAAAKLRFLNPDLVVEPYRMRVDETNAAGLIEGQDLVIDCSDSFETRYAVNAACCAAGIDLVEGGAVGWTGLVMTVLPGRGAVLPLRVPGRAGGRAVLRRGGYRRTGRGRHRLAAGARGAEAADGRRRAPLTDAFLTLDLATLETTRVSVHRRPDCPDCGGL